MRACSLGLLLLLAGCNAPAPVTIGTDAAPRDLTPIVVDIWMPDLYMPPDLTVVPPDLAMPDLTDLTMGPDLMCPPCGVKPTDCNGNIITTYGEGNCMDGACVWPSSMNTCTNGCYVDMTGKPQCVQTPLNFLGMTAASSATSGASVAIGVVDNGGSGDMGGTAPASDGVAITTQTYPHGATKEVHLLYSLTDVTVAMPTDVMMTFDKEVAPNDQWKATIPAQPAGTRVWFYVRAVGWGGAMLYDPTNFHHLTYVYQ
jgi:hypothetical protein